MQLLQACKPDSVSRRRAGMAIIYLYRQLPAGIHLPTLQCYRDEPVIGRAALSAGHWFMWHFSMQGLPAIDVATNSRELLPHVFTFYLRSKKFPPCCCLIPATRDSGNYFLWHCLLSLFSPGHPALHRCITLCCPDFPSRLSCRRNDNPACSSCKNNLFPGSRFKLNLEQTTNRQT